MTIASPVRLDSATGDALVVVDDLTITVPSASGRVNAVTSVSLTIRRGETVGLVGESGSGKTLTCRALLGVLPAGCEVTKGSIFFDGRDLAALSPKDWEAVHGARIGAIFQDPTSYLTPSIPVGRQVMEVLRLKSGLSKKKAKSKTIELFSAIGLQNPVFVYDQLPSELSGGMLQRVMIAIAISASPGLVVADEATTALDVVTQAEVIRLLASLREQFNNSVLFISHDLVVVAQLCDRIVVFYAGEVVEIAEKHAIVSRPLHPYTEALLWVGAPGRKGADLQSIPGQPPTVGAQLAGCRFAGRCPFEVAACTEGPIPLRELEPGRYVRCIRAEELALEGDHLVHG